MSKDPGLTQAKHLSVLDAMLELEEAERAESEAYQAMSDSSYMSDIKSEDMAEFLRRQAAARRRYDLARHMTSQVTRQLADAAFAALGSVAVSEALTRAK